MDFFQNISRPTPNKSIDYNPLENLIKNNATVPLKGNVSVDYINKVKDKLISSIMRFDPNEGGGSLLGYFKGVAIPFEGLRVRTEFIEGEGSISKVELDKPVGEGQRSIEIESEGYFDKKLDSEDLSIGAQRRYEEYLKEAGLEANEAEAYLPTGKGIDVAKYIGLEVPKIDIFETFRDKDGKVKPKIQFTTREKFEPKKSATFSNPVAKFLLALIHFGVSTSPSLDISS